MIRRPSLLAVALVCLITLAGCSDSSSSSPEGDASPTEASTFGGPAMPGDAQGESRDAAEAFVRHWIDTLNYATETGETEGLKSLAAKGCSNCDAFASRLDEVYGEGGRVETDNWSIKSAVPEGDRPEGNSAFQLMLMVPPQKVYATRGGEPESYPGGDQPARIALIREGDHWLVESLDM